MTRAILESPFAVDSLEIESAKRSDDWTWVKAAKERNRRYLRALALWAIELGYSPYASHAMLTQWLNDDDPIQRTHGIKLGFEWAAAANVALIGVDLGVSSGMHTGIKRHIDDGRERTFVRLGNGWEAWETSYPIPTVELDVRTLTNPTPEQLTQFLHFPIPPIRKVDP